MSILTFYIIFCLTTSICAVYEIFWPCLQAAIKDGIKNELTEAPWLSSFVFLVLNTILAPMVFLVIIIPSLHTNAVKGINKVMREPQKT